MIRQQGHWICQWYVQKLTRKQLKEYLLNESNNVVYAGITTPLIHKHLGVGVYELKKNMKVYFEKIGEEPVFTPSWY